MKIYHELYNDNFKYTQKLIKSLYDTSKYGNHGESLYEKNVIYKSIKYAMKNKSYIK